MFFCFSVPSCLPFGNFQPLRSSFQGSVGHIIGSLGGDRVTVLFEPAKQAADEPRNIPEYPASCLVLFLAETFSTSGLKKCPSCGDWTLKQRLPNCLAMHNPNSTFSDRIQ